MILHKYIDQGGNAFANIEYAPKDRVLLSHTNTGFAVLRMIWGGRLPVKTLYSVHSLIMERMMRVLARDTSLPERPKGRYEKDEAAMAMFLDNLPPRPIALLTRFAATAVSSADLIRKLERLQNIPG